MSVPTSATRPSSTSTCAGPYSCRVGEQTDGTTSTRPRPGGRTARVTGQVLDATVQLIAEQGAAAVTYDAVAKRAGTSRATLYRKWPQREDLLSPGPS